VEPEFVLLENVPGLISSGYFATVLGNLAESGYDARWRVLSAGEVGAPHRRDRLWVVAYTSGTRTWDNTGATGGQGREPSAPGSSDVRQRDWAALPGGVDAVGEDVADAEGNPQRAGLCQGGEEGQRGGRLGHGGSQVAHTSTEGLPPPQQEALPGGGGGEEGGAVAKQGWWGAEPPLGRVAHGVADRVGQLRALGNGQVPAVVAAVWGLLTDDL
jgi:DNA (cytosine-5)-methyltransferase 1